MGLPFLITEHNTYISITSDYIHPTLLQSYRKKRFRQIPTKKVDVKKRNSRIIQIGHACNWATFITLTFGPDHYWSDYKKFQHCFRLFTKSIYYRVGSFKYLAVLEHGGKTSRIHFHMLTDIPYANYIFEHAFHTRRKVCHLWDYGFSDVVKVDNKRCNAVFYLAKYLTKDDVNRTPIGKREVFSSRGLNRVTKTVIKDPTLLIAGLKEYVRIGKSIIYLKPKK